jgi:hypothetical protein
MQDTVTEVFEGTVKWNLPSTSVAVPSEILSVGMTAAPITGNPSVFDTTVPSTEIDCAKEAIEKRPRTKPKIAFFIIAVDLIVVNSKLLFNTRKAYMLSDGAKLLARG